jgi:hypothetical protein
MADRKPYVQLTDEQTMDIWLLRHNRSESQASIAERYDITPGRVAKILADGQKCENGCGRITTSESGFCKTCVIKKRRRSTPITDVQREQIASLRERGMTYAAIAAQLDISVSKVRKVLDPEFQGKRSCRNGIIRTERRNGKVTFVAIAVTPGTRRQVKLGPYASEDEAEEARRAWKAKKLGVGTPAPRKERPDLSDVYGNIRLALRNLDAADVPMVQERAIFTALHEAEDLVRVALRDEYAARFRVPVTA